MILPSNVLPFFLPPTIFIEWLYRTKYGAMLVSRDMKIKHLFIHSTDIQKLLCARHCFKPWRYSSECTYRVYILVVRQTTSKQMGKQYNYRQVL